MNQQDLTSAATVAFDVENLHKSYRLEKHSVNVLNGLDMTIPAAAWTCLVGPSGCGKTTLLQLLGSLDEPTQGRISCLGTDYAKLSENAKSKLRREKIGFVFQAFNLFPELDACENVALPGLLPGRNRRQAYVRAKDLLNACGLSDRIRHRPRELSGGEQQRVAIARALINDPRIILADEPTGNLDQASGGEVIEILRKLSADEGKTLVMVTHDLRMAAQAEHVFTMDNGRIAPAGEITARQ